MFGERAGNFLIVQEFQAKRKKFLAQLAHVQEEYEEAFNYSCTCKKYGDFAGIFPFLPAIHSSYTFFLHISECAWSMLPALLHVQEVFQ